MCFLIVSISVQTLSAIQLQPIAQPILILPSLAAALLHFVAVLALRVISLLPEIATQLAFSSLLRLSNALPLLFVPLVLQLVGFLHTLLIDGPLQL